MKPLLRKTKSDRSEYPQSFALSFPHYNLPAVSVVILTYNRVSYTISCLMNLKTYTKDVEYELIVVDNGSTDETHTLLNSLDAVTVIKNEINKGYSYGCNQGASKAQGEYVLFLNNDTAVTSGWLKNLLTLAKSKHDVGAVGPKLIHFDGTLQAAGCEHTDQGWFPGRGAGDAPDNDDYMQIREVEALYGACILLKKSVFCALGGFDTSFTPAYHEDIDLCLRLRNRGYKLFYQPDSHVYHHGFSSTLPNVRNELLVKNHEQLLSKWGGTIAKDRYGPLKAHYCEKDEEILYLRNELLSIKRSVVWRCVLFIDRVVNAILPQGTKARKLYDAFILHTQSLINRDKKIKI